MEETNFRVFCNILRYLKTEDESGQKLGETITTLIRVFYKYLTEDQAKQLSEEFSAYQQQNTIPEKPPEVKLKEPKDEDFPPEKMSFKRDWF